jgi:ABC-type nitrate/sulfonate/bicarbonate transport system ATPase subunit
MDRPVIKSKSIGVSGLEMTFSSSRGAVHALKPTDLQVPAGQFLAVVGPSGCGKSTLLNILAGFLTPTGGAARIGDEPVTGPDIDHGVVFQDYALFPWRSVIDNVAFGLEQQGVPRGKRYEIAQSYLAVVGLKDFARRRPRELSGGMKQRVAIARAFATDPSVILMDEPFGALDALTRRFLQQQLLRIWQQNQKTILFITHSVQEAVYLADRIIVMTARPGTIKSDYMVDLPRPRDYASDRFREMERVIFSDLDAELAKSFDLSVEGVPGD